MTPNPQTGLVGVVDRAAKDPSKVLQMWPIDFKEAVLRGGDLKDNGKRFVLAENYVPPDPA